MEVLFASGAQTHDVHDRIPEESLLTIKIFIRRALAPCRGDQEIDMCFETAHDGINSIKI